MCSKSHLFQNPGQRYKDFILTKVVVVGELQCTIRELIHEPSEAKIIHIENDDSENLFNLSFKTLPYSSNGIAHILEHTVLCGSKKFPVKDPFFAMNRRSLNTFMNALTGADFTCYPAATQVTKDFYNLLEVYLDAVFFPNLNELSFLQEGWRLEFSTPDDPTTPLEFKGIVYNEMKGALSSGSARLFEQINDSLFPNVTYGYNSGGDPKNIPELTYNELKAFHQQYYHPSQCLFFFYGNMPLEGHLDFIYDHLLKDTTKGTPVPEIPLQPRFEKPQYLTSSYPIAAEEETVDKTMIAFGWLTCHILEQEDVLALNILEIILLDTDASPLKMAFLKSGLCKQVNCFIDTEVNEIPFGIILKGCNEENANALETVLKETLNLICESGISLQMIENAIHQLEFARSEITGDHAPFGLSLFFRSALLKHHDVDPEQGLFIHTLFDQIRQQTIEDPAYLTKLIRKYLIDNPHFVRLVMTPDKALQAKEEEEEKSKLDQIKNSLTEKESQEIVEKAKELIDFQEKQAEESLDILPKVSVKEIPLSAKDFPLIQEQVGVLKTYHHNTFTNNIVYADLAFNLPNLTENDLFYLRLLTVILNQVGCGKRNYVENLDYIQGNTGGIGSGISLNLQAKDYHLFYPTFHLRGKALYQKAPKLFSLMFDTVNSIHLNDHERLKEIIVKHYTAIESRINQSSLKYAINLSSSGLSSSAKMADELYGLPYFWKLKDLVQNYDKEFPKLLLKFEELVSIVMKIENPDLIVTCDARMFDQLKGQGFYGLNSLEGVSSNPWKCNYPYQSIIPQGRVVASSVAFIGKVFPSVSYIDQLAPALNLAANLFDNLTLHPRIREQGGAYGGGAVNSPMSGHFYFYSYRDPNILKTLQAFEEAIEAVSKGNFSEEDLEEAKLEMIQSLDSPVAPGSRGELAYGWMREGRSHAMRQAFRKKLLETDRESIIHAVNTIIKPNYESGSMVVFAGKQLLEEENKKLEAEGVQALAIESI